MISDYSKTTMKFFNKWRSTINWWLMKELGVDNLVCSNFGWDLCSIGNKFEVIIYVYHSDWDIGEFYKCEINRLTEFKSVRKFKERWRGVFDEC